MAKDSTAKTKADNRMGRTEIEQGDHISLEETGKAYAQEIKDAQAEEQLSPTQEFEKKLLVDVSELILQDLKNYQKKKKAKLITSLKD